MSILFKVQVCPLSNFKCLLSGMSRAPPNSPQSESAWQRFNPHSHSDELKFPTSLLYSSSNFNPDIGLSDPTLELLRAGNDDMASVEDVIPNSIHQRTTANDRSTAQSVQPVDIYRHQERDQLEEWKAQAYQFGRVLNDYYEQREPAPPPNVNVFVGNSDSTQLPGHEESSAPSSSSSFRFEFPAAADAIKKILAESNLQTYRIEERFILLLTFCVTRGILCQAGDFVFPKLFIDMITLWNNYEPDGFRVVISSLQNNTLPTPIVPARDEQKVDEGAPAQPSQTQVSESKAADEQQLSLPTTEEYVPEQDIFADLAEINEAGEDLEISNAEAEPEARPRTQQTQTLQSQEIQNSIATSSRQHTEEEKEEIAITEAFDDPREQSESLQPGHRQLVHEVSADLGRRREEMKAIQRTYAQLEDEFLTGPQTPVQENEDDHVAYVTQQFEATPSTRTRQSSSRVSTETKQRIVVSDEDSESPDEPILRTNNRSPEPSPASPGAEIEGPERIGGRQRAYNPLRVDNESGWAQRAQQRAGYWTKRLAVMKEQGIITDDDWDGTPITPDQWNNRRGGSVLRDLFKRDRLVEYQAYRRDIQRQTNERDGTQIREDLMPPPFDRKGRKGRGGKKRKNTTTGTAVKGGNYKQGATRLDDVIDFGKSHPAASARQVMNQMNMAKLTRKGRGLLQKQFHVFIVSPKSVAWVDNDSGSGHYLSTVTAKIALMTFLFLANPKYGDALREGIAELVYQLGFEDIFNLFRFQPQFIPKKYADLFTGKDAVQGGPRWNKTGRPRRFASFVDQWTKKAAEKNPDQLKITVLILNALIQLQLIDNLHSSIEMGGRVKTAPPAYNEDGVNGTVALVSNLGIDLEDILTLQKDIKASFHENIDYFMSHAAHRLYARQDS